MNEKYEISRHTSEAAEATKVGFLSLWGKAKTFVAKKEPEQPQAAAAQAQPSGQSASPEESKDPQTAQ